MNPQIPEVLKYESLSQAVSVGDIAAGDVGVVKYTDSNCNLITLTSGYAVPYLQTISTGLLGNTNPNILINQPIAIDTLLSLSNISSFTSVLTGSGISENTNYGPFDDSSSHFFIFWDCFSQIETFSECQNCACTSSLFQCSRDLGPYQQRAYEQAIRDCPDTLYLGNLNASLAQQFIPEPVLLSGSATNRYGCEECIGCYGSYVDGI